MCWKIGCRSSSASLAINNQKIEKNIDYNVDIHFIISNLIEFNNRLNFNFFYQTYAVINTYGLS